MDEALFERVRKLDQEYFGNRDLGRLIRAMDAQIRSMEKMPTLATSTSKPAIFCLYS
jgi:hypothetical protein